MKVRFHLKDPKKSESLIVARILWGNNQLPYSSKQIIPTKFWIAKNDKGERVQEVQRTTKYPSYSEVNQSLGDLKMTIQRIFLRYLNENEQQVPSKPCLKSLLDEHFRRGKSKIVEVRLPTFMEYLEHNFIERSKKGIRVNRKTSQALSPDTVKTYYTLLGHLKAYNPNLDWKDINLNLHSDFTEFLMEEYDLSNSSIGKDFSIIKVVCSEAYYEKINKYDDYTNPLFSVSRETADSIHLNEEEINLLWNMNLSHNKNLEETRDLFVMGCVTGLRYSDYSKIQPAQIDGNKLHVKTVKGNKRLEVNIRHPKAQSIIVKYNKKLPQGAANQVFNRYLKDLCKSIPQFQTLIEKSYTKGGKRVLETVPKYEMIKSHSARRSYCTNEVEAGTPIPIIMANSGHSSEKSFWKYVKLNKSHYHKMYDDILIERYSIKAVV